MKLKTVFQRQWPFLLSVAVLLIILTLLIVSSLRKTERHLVYALDDAYIHMAIAKNLSVGGLWGVTSYEFSSASSSLLWTSLVASVYTVFGVNEIASLALNFVFSILLLWFVFDLGRKYELSPWLNFLLLNLIIFLTPLPTLILEGMEHVLQILLNLVFVFLSVKALRNLSISPMEKVVFFLASCLVVAIRYEGLFLVFVVCCLLMIQKRLRDAILLGTIGVLPVAIFGFVSVLNGWYFLPNSVLLKAQMLGGLPEISTARQVFLTLMRAEKQLLDAPHLYVLVIVSLFSLLHYSRAKDTRSVAIIWNAIFISTAWLHLQFAGTGWFFRYEAYLVALGIVAVGISLAKMGDFRASWPALTELHVRVLISATVLGGILILPLFHRAWKALGDTPQAAANIYQQQYQMGKFVREFYAGSVVAVNDIGAVSFLSDPRLFDLVGLATLSVAGARRSHQYDGAVMAALTKKEQVKIAILYDPWFAKSGIPGEWRKVGEWKILHRAAVDHDTISFYAVASGQEDSLISNLQRFSSRLPREVQQKGKYLEAIEKNNRVS